jgi:hypothetical protein
LDAEHPGEDGGGQFGGKGEQGCGAVLLWSNADLVQPQTDLAVAGPCAYELADDTAGTVGVQVFLDVADQSHDQADRIGENLLGDRRYGHRSTPVIRARPGRSSPTPSEAAVPPAAAFLGFFAAPPWRSAR